MPRPVELAAMIADAARLLPQQGPIGTFVAQNPLHGFETLPFEQAVIRAARVYRAEPFLPESDYRAHLASGRIRVEDIDAVLDADVGVQAGRPLAGGLATLGRLHRLLLLHPVRLESDAAVRWTLAESDALERLRDDLPPEARARILEGVAAEGGDPADAAGDLWHACVEAASRSRASVGYGQPPARHRDLILAVAPALDTDALVHPLIIRIVAAFLDQGVASWPMPERDRGLLGAAAAVYGSRHGPLEDWAGAVPGRLGEIHRAFEQGGVPDEIALDVVAAELHALGVPESAWPGYIAESAVALRGWAAMVRQLEERPDRAPVTAVPARLADFVALRLVLDRAAVDWAADRLGRPRGPRSADAARLLDFWVELRDRHPPRRGPGAVARSFLLFQVAQLLGLRPAEIRDLGDNEFRELEDAIADFDAVARRRCFHLAYERRHRIGILDALAAARRRAESRQGSVHDRVARPRAQAVFCIDDRCESFRRALEESDADVATYGAAGFFAVAMYFRGIDDWHAVPLCPIVIRPGHTVLELPEAKAVGDYRLRQALRRSYGRVRGGLLDGSRSLLSGGVLATLGGALAAVPLVARVAFPRLTAVLAARAADIARRRVPTHLGITRSAEGLLPDGTRDGFDSDEMAGIVRRLLEDIGLTSGFARLVAVVGHGSTSLNNPHESAYDCGACGGGKGGPNARAFALMANDPAVRARLAAGGLAIPDDVWFVGGMLDTCTSTVTWFDTEGIPAGHRGEFDSFRRLAVLAGGLDARERCRRFDSVPGDVSEAEALRRVEGRAADLAQVRPEYGHAGNAVCVVGRRSLSRGLFLDRRSFLVSYDPRADRDGAILERTLAAVGPVCGGINLAYLFSRVDPLGYGAGTKLPHNITGLIGVMDGHASDLRTGLPFQGVDIHEPVRLLIVVDAAPERIAAVLERLPAVRRMVANRWVQLVAWDPASGAMSIQDGAGGAIAFSPYQPETDSIPHAVSSAAWYRGRREDLAPALVGVEPGAAGGRAAP